MKFSRMAAMIAMIGLSTPALAGTEQAMGKLVSADQGTFVARDGKLLPAFAGQQLYAGDRVVTGNGAKARAAMPGCSYTLAPTSMLSVSGCSSTTQAFTRDLADGDGNGSNKAGAYWAGAGAAHWLIPVFVVVAIFGGAYAGFSHTSGSPASP